MMSDTKYPIAGEKAKEELEVEIDPAFDSFNWKDKPPVINKSFF
jgi:hypothetical protein